MHFVPTFSKAGGGTRPTGPIGWLVVSMRPPICECRGGASPNKHTPRNLFVIRDVRIKLRACNWRVTTGAVCGNVVVD